MPIACHPRAKRSKAQEVAVKQDFVVNQLSRRKVLKGAGSVALLAPGAITGFPAVHGVISSRRPFGQKSAKASTSDLALR